MNGVLSFVRPRTACLPRALAFAIMLASCATAAEERREPAPETTGAETTATTSTTATTDERILIIQAAGLDPGPTGFEMPDEAALERIGDALEGASGVSIGLDR